MVKNERRNEAQRKLKARIIRMRKARKENQATFWNRLGVTQSSGSRYESSGDDLRYVPAPVELLVDLVYGSNPLGKLSKLRGSKLVDLIPTNRV